MKSILLLVLALALPAFAQPAGDQMSAAAPVAEKMSEAKPTATSEAGATGEDAPATPRAPSITEVWSPEIAPLSFFLGYGLRLDRERRVQNGTQVGVEFRLVPRLSLQFQTLFGFRPREDFGDTATGWRAKNDLWAIFNLGAKWSPLLFTLNRHPADVFFTAGALTATSTGGAVKVGTNYYIGTGATYYFEPTVKGVLDLRGTPGHRGYGQLSAGINFQFP